MRPPASTDEGPDLRTETSATALTGVTTVEVLSDGSGSVTPIGVVTVVLLLIAPVLVGLTVPAIVNVALPPAGSVGTNPLTTLAPFTLTVAGHTAPPAAPEQLAVTPVMLVGTTSIKLALFAGLGPALLIVMV